MKLKKIDLKNNIDCITVTLKKGEAPAENPRERQSTGHVCVTKASTLTLNKADEPNNF